MIRKAEERDASSLAALSIEVWLNTYLRDGVSPLFADYVLSEFTAQKFRDSIGDPNLAICVSENRMGIDGFVTVCSTAAFTEADIKLASGPINSLVMPAGKAMAVSPR
jgi:hypothetical protein